MSYDLATMSLVLTSADHDNLCHGWSWQIADEEALVDQVARVSLSQYRHVEKILAGLNTRNPTTNAELVADAIAKLSPDADGSTWRRDGWLFQIISWIAAHHKKGGAVIRAPHIRKADHGFDGLQLDLSDDGTSVTAVVLSEDKATDNPRNTITSKVWPEISKLEEGERITELSHDATVLLSTQLDVFSGEHIEQAIEDIIWKDARRFRVSVTVKDEHEAEDARRALFVGYDERAGGDVVRRRAETMCIPDLREWMQHFSDRVAARIAELAPNV